MLERMGWSKGKVSVVMDLCFLCVCVDVVSEWMNISVARCYVFSFHVKGLGRSEQGSTDHIKVKVKNNNYGLGANASYEVRTFNT